MDIVLVSPEIAPFSQRTEAADVVAGLAKALRGREHRVTVISPLYRSIDPTAKALARRLTGVEVPLPGEDDPVDVHLFDGRTAAGVELVFLASEPWFGSASAIDDGDPETRARRAGLFGRAAVAAIASRPDVAGDVVHGHDWPGALALVAARAETGLGARLVWTLHDDRALGSFPPALAPALGIDPGHTTAGDEVHAALAGVRAADRTTAGSPGHARQILRGAADERLPPGQAALVRALADLGDRFVGIPSGVDASRWNAATDAHLDHRFDPMDLSGKRRNKAAVQHDLGLPIRGDVPLVGLLVNPAPGCGARAVLEILPEVLRNDVQVVATFRSDPGDAGPDAATLADDFEELSGLWAERLQVRRAPEESRTHRILGGADLLIVPHERDPHGTLARTAQRYGALPVAPAVAGLEDAIVDCDAKLKTGTGFVADDASPGALLAAVRRALAAYADPRGFEALQQRVMRVDQTWDRAAYLYERLYSQ